MTLRLGVDLMRLDRLDRLTQRPWFLGYMYADQEVADAAALGATRRVEFLAGRFAAKEAVLKVLGVGLFRGVRPQDITLTRSDTGAPAVRLRASAAAAAGSAGLSQVSVSITHSHGLVVAVAAGW